MRIKEQRGCLTSWQCRRYLCHMATPPLKKVLLRAVGEGGELLLRYFGKVRNIQQKGEQASVVCEADVACETHIRKVILEADPEANIIGEEQGSRTGRSPYTWVADPLDGTSNFVAGLSWFGCQAGILQNGKPIMAAMFLPVERTLFFAARGEGVWRNGKKMLPPESSRLKDILCAFGFDASADTAERRRHCELLMRIASAVRNTRATNSLLDFCYTLEGKFGACVNLNCKLWDIVPAALMIPELGGKFTDLQGKLIDFELGTRNFEHSYQILGAPRRLHAAMLRAITAAN